MGKSARPRARPPARPVPKPPNPLWKVLRAARFFVSHTGIAAVIITCIWALEFWFRTLWGQADPLLFDVLPLRYLFHAIDVGVIGVFGWYTVCSAAAAFNE
jgi:hypothetical protein